MPYTDSQMKLLEHWAKTGDQREADGALPLLPKFDLFGPRGPALVVENLLQQVFLARTDLGAMERHNKRLVNDLHAADESLRDRVMMALLPVEIRTAQLSGEVVSAAEAGRRAYASADAVLSQRNGKPQEKP
jgi:hypothetical protein